MCINIKKSYHLLEKKTMKLNFNAIASYAWSKLAPIKRIEKNNKRKNLKWHIATKPKAKFYNLKDQNKKCKWSLYSFYDDHASMIQEQKCPYVVMMKFLGFGAFGHATSSFVHVFSWKIFYMNLWFWRFSIIESEKIKF